MSRIIAGRQPVMEALRAGARIERVVFLQGVHGRVIEDIKSLALKKKVRFVEIARQEFRDIASDATTQGVVALVSEWQQFADLDALLRIPDERKETGFLLVLDELEDPHNLGALIRTAECTGVHGAIIPKHHAASVTNAVAKASAGAVEHMAIAEVTNIVNTLKELKLKGYWIVGLDAAGDKLYTDIDYKSPTAIVIGNEGNGIRRLVKEHCDYLARIPLYGRIESLNASVAGALVMYEITRQRIAS